jgi:gliding motility-associated-like protein
MRKIFLLLIAIHIGSALAYSQIIFSTPGTYNWTVPPCVTSITVQVWAGGGGGGSVWSRFDPTSSGPTSNEACVTAGGGGGGGFVNRTYTAVPGQVYTIVVGAGGNGGSINSSGNNRANAGSPGGNSTFSGPATSGPGTLTAYGGLGGGAANFLRSCLGGCSGAVHQGANGAGGNGSGGANGTTTFNGGNGSSGAHNGSTNDKSGAGGGGAGSTGNGAAASSTTAGNGGSGGGGKGGDGIVQAYGNGFLGTNGNNGITIGGGGGGAAGHNRSSNNNSHYSRVGGSGARGEVRINYTTPSLPEPTFNSVASICNGGTLNSLPTTSNNGINGSWSPSLNNTATTTYIFTPSPSGPCADTTSLTIVVNPATTPTFTQVSPICNGGVLNPLPTTSNNGITGTWSPALNNTNTTTYTFTPNTGQCASTATMTITVNPIITPSFTAVAPICSGNTLNALPTTSNNGISGIWSPALNNTTTTTYTFTPNSGQCGNTTTMTITVNNSITPTFAPVAAICSGEPLSPLPTTSNNGIAGSWSPSVNNTATTTYTFTPNSGQCANNSSMTITVNPATIPTFNSTPAICTGDILNPLPNTSNNGITGTWSPALNNTTTTTYTFTPISGQCANPTTMTIIVNPIATPTFNTIAPICNGEVLSPLPSTSNNNIVGSWSPVLNNTTTTTYTFTPNNNQCATSTTMTITVNNVITPSFTTIAPICNGSPIAPLPTTSNNGITGTWSPVLNNTTTTTYTFTPDANQCAAITTITITVNQPSAIPMFNSVSPICSGEVLNPLQITSINGITGTWSPALNNTTTTTYTFTPNLGQCGVGTTLTIVVNPNPTLIISNPQAVCSPNTVDITNSIVTSGSSNGSFSYWTNPTCTNPLVNPSNISNSATYYIQLTTSSGCQSIQPVTVIINETPNLIITNPSPICAPNTINLTAPSVTNGSSGGNLTYWQNAGASIQLSSPQSISNSGTYYIQSTSGAGCSVIEDVVVTIMQPPTPIIGADNLSGCSPLCVNFSNSLSSSNSSWSWSFGTAESSSLAEPTYCFSNSGKYNVTLTVTDQNGCSANTSPITITVHPTPIANFSTSSNTVSMLNENYSIEYYNQSSSDVVSWFWDFGTGTTISPNQPDPVVDYTGINSGNYTTTLTVYNSYGCSDQITSEIVVESYFAFFIPNAFTPNNDGANETFFGKGVGITEYNLTIFDRWGEVIFESNDIEKGWDGRAKGGNEIAQKDVYVWKVNLKDIFNKKHEYIGKVSLIK